MPPFLVPVIFGVAGCGFISIYLLKLAAQLYCMSRDDILHNGF